MPLRTVLLCLLLTGCPAPLEPADIVVTVESDDCCADSLLIYTDSDGDGYGDPYTARIADALSPGSTEEGGDCDDSDAEIRPGAEEVCDGVDNDCDLQVDEGMADGDGDGVCDAIDDDDTADNTGVVPDTYVAIASGQWSNPDIWSVGDARNKGSVPGGDDYVILNSGIHVTCDDQAPGAVEKITLNADGEASSLTLERDLEVTVELWARDGTLLDIGSHTLSGDFVQMGNTSEEATLQRAATTPGTLSFREGRFYNASHEISRDGESSAALTLYAGDEFERLGLTNAFAGNSGDVLIESNIVSDTLFFNENSSMDQVVTLDVDLVLSGNLEFRQEVVIEDSGYDITVGGTLTNFTSFTTSGHFYGTLRRSGGTMTVGAIDLGRATDGFALRPGDVVTGDVNIFQQAGTCPELALVQTSADGYDPGAGLTIEDSSATVSIDCAGTGASPLGLYWDSALSASGHDWTLRWRGSHAEALRALISDGSIVIGSVPSGETFDADTNVFYDSGDGYTYIAF